MQRFDKAGSGYMLFSVLCYFFFLCSQLVDIIKMFSKDKHAKEKSAAMLLPSVEADFGTISLLCSS